jgi:hypothetical protein
VNSKSLGNTVVVVLLIGAILLIGLAIYIPNTRPARKASIRIPQLQRYFETCRDFVKLEESKGIEVKKCQQNSDESLPNSYSQVGFDRKRTTNEFWIYLISPEKSYRYDYSESDIQEIKP